MTMTYSLRSPGVGAAFGEALDVMRATHGPEAQITIKLMQHDHDTGRKRMIKVVHGTSLEHFKALPKWFDQHWEAFMMIGLTDSKGHAVHNVLEVRAIAIDFDGEVDLLKSTGPAAKPSYVVDTSSGHQHAVWLLEDPIPPAEASGLMRAMAKRLGGDPACVAANHVVRLPGSVNHKRGSLVRLEAPLKDARKFSSKFLADAFDVRLVTNFLRHSQPRFDQNLGITAPILNRDALIEDLRSALTCVDATPHGMWIKFGLALQELGPDGFELWRNWSSMARNFDASTISKKWNSLAQSGHQQVRPSSIFFEAASHGWKNPGYRREKTDGTGEVQLTDRRLGKLIAQELGDDFSVLRDPDKKHAITFFRKVGDKSCRLDDIERREEVEKVAGRIAAGMKSKDHSRFVESRSGSNQALDSLCEHIAEYMLKETAKRDASGYPYLALENGVMNQITGNFVPGVYGAVSIWSSSVSYDPAAKAPRFELFLQQIFDNDTAMIQFALRLLGHVLLGNPVEQIIVVFIGAGGNGKSKLVNVLKTILGPYAVSMAASAITVRSHSGPQAAPEIARLQHKRLAVISEIGDKHGIDAGLIKNLTGGEDITARGLFGNYEDFLPVLVPILLTNKTPKIREDDGGLWRRLLFVEFPCSFEGANKDAQLEVKLKRELPGIFNMILAGAHDYLLNGLAPPKKVSCATEKQRSDVDPFEDFFAECLMGEVGAETPFKLIRELYAEWRTSNLQLRRLTPRELAEKLVSKNFKKLERRHLVYYLGVVPRILPDDPS